MIVPFLEMIKISLLSLSSLKNTSCSVTFQANSHFFMCLIIMFTMFPSPHCVLSFFLLDIAHSVGAMLDLSHHHYYLPLLTRHKLILPPHHVQHCPPGHSFLQHG